MKTDDDVERLNFFMPRKWRDAINRVRGTLTISEFVRQCILDRIDPKRKLPAMRKPGQAE